MKHLSSYIQPFLALLALLAAACQKTGITVPEPVTDLKAYPGLNRAKVEFAVPADAVSAKVFHSSGKYVLAEIEDPSAIQSVMAEGLSAGENILRVVTLNSEGLNSDPRGVRVQVYDESYGNGLENRDLIEQIPVSSTSVEMYFSDAPEGEVELRIEYTGTGGGSRTVSLTPEQTFVTIEDIDMSEDYVYYSVYKPSADFIDEYHTEPVNARTAAMKNFDKALWQTADGVGNEAIDDDAATAWTAAEGVGSCITVDMQTEKTYNGFSIVQKGDMSSTTFASRMIFEASGDNVEWRQISNPRLRLNGYRQTYGFDEPVTSRYFRIRFTETHQPDLPISVAEIDLYNELRTSGENGETMPQLVNGKVPFETDGSDLCPAAGAGRFQRISGWNHENGAYITADLGSGSAQFCTWCAPAWGCSAIDNGKVFQVLDLLPGVYGFKLDVGHTTDPDGVDMYAVVAQGVTLPVMDDLTSAEVLAYGDVVEHCSSVYTIPFTVTESCNVAIGLVYSLYDMYGITGFVWSDMYMNSFEIEAQ